MIKTLKIILLCVLFLAPSLFFGQEKDKEKPQILAPAQIYKPVGTKQIPETTDKDLAFQYYSSQDFEKAALYFQKLYDDQPSSFYYRYLLYSLIGTSDFDKALALIKKAKKADKDKGSYMVDEGYIYILNNDSKKGYKLYDDAIDKLDANDNAIRSLANAFWSVRELKYTIKTYLKGREILKNKLLFFNELGSAYKQNQDYRNMACEYLDYALYYPKMIQHVYNTFQNYMSNDPDGLISDAIRNELLIRIQTETNSTFYTDMMLWYSIQIKDFDLAFRQIKAIDKINKEEGINILDFADVCFQNGDFTTATESYNYIISTYKKSNPSVALMAQIGLVDMDYSLLQSNENITAEYLQKLDDKFTSLLKETDMSVDMLPTMINAADLKAFYLHKSEDAINLLYPLLSTTKRPIDIANIKLALGDIYIASDNPWDAILCYSQVEKSMKDEPLGHEAKYRNAMVSYYIGEFGWAETKLDVLKASTEKLIANDAMKLSLFIKDNKDEDSTSMALRYFAKADLAVFNKQFDAALALLDSASSVNAWSLIEDDVLYKKAKIYIDKRKYNTADSLLSIINEKYHDEIIADESLYTRAIINEKYLLNKDVAIKLYEQVILDYPESIFTVAAREKYRELRGDANIRIINPDDDIIYVPLFSN